MIEVSHVTCGYGKEMIIKDVSFAVEKNQILCILGANGSGKTTLLRALAGLIPANGSIVINGLEIAKASRLQIAKKVGLLGQLATTYFSYTVYDTVKMARYAKKEAGLFSGTDKKEEAIIMESLKIVGMEKEARRNITELSGGQLQRVFLARVLAQDPDVILLDEPTNHLDLKYQIELLSYIKEWVKKKDRCVIGVLHDINHAFLFADKIVLLQDGSIAYMEESKQFVLDRLNEAYGIDVGAYMRTALHRWDKI